LPRQGYTEITVVPTSKDLRTLHLHSRQCSKSHEVPCDVLLRENVLAVHSVTVASHPADFVYNDPLANLSISNSQDVHLHPELKRRVYSALAEGEEGELSIAIPKEVSLRQSGHAATGIASEGTPLFPRLLVRTSLSDHLHQPPPLSPRLLV